jgi:hypothetical protein
MGASPPVLQRTQNRTDCGLLIKSPNNRSVGILRILPTSQHVKGVFLGKMPTLH